MLKRKLCLMLDVKEPSLPVTIFAGSCAGMANWSASLPQDTVKTAMQVNESYRNKSTWYVTKEVWKAGGIKAFYRGYTPAMIRAVPVSATCFSVYEFILRYMD